VVPFHIASITEKRDILLRITLTLLDVIFYGAIKAVQSSYLIVKATKNSDYETCADSIHFVVAITTINRLTQRSYSGQS
jgi:hypothetical protein